MSFDFIMGRGQRHTNKYDGCDYETGTFQDLWEMAANPPSVDKADATWGIFTDTNGHLARDLAYQKEHGAATALWADIDEGSPTQAQVVEAVRKIFPNTAFLVYHSRSTTAAIEKHRIIIPLLTKVQAAAVKAYLMALNRALVAQGLAPDPVNEVFTQLCFFPNAGERYDPPHFEPGGRLDIQVFPEFTDLAIGCLADVEREELERAERAQRFRDSGGQRNETSRSAIAAFRRKHPTHELLELYGAETLNGKDYHFPSLQEGSSYATELFDDGGMYTLSGSVGAIGGNKQGAGWYFGDGFDLYVHFTCQGNREAALAYAKQCLQEEDDKRFGAATVEHGKALWAACCRAKAEAAAAIAETVRIEVDESHYTDNEWDLDWPPGLLGELAKWIYMSSSRPIKQYSIAAAFHFYTVGAARYEFDGECLNLFMMLVGGTGRGKGVVRRAQLTIIKEIANKAQNPTLALPYTYEVAVSEAGIQKALSIQNPICAYEEELGMSLLPLTSIKASANDIGIRKTLTKLYDGTQLGTKEAADKDRRRAFVEDPRMTLSGDTQPHVFRGLLSNDAVDSGFAPRMVPFIYDGPRKYHNEDAKNHKIPPPALVDNLRGYVEYCLNMTSAKVHVKWGAGVEQLYNEAEMRFTDTINDGRPGAEMYNRAGANIKRLAAYLAIGDNYLDPEVTAAHWQYAAEIVNKGLTSVQQILASGGAGQGESVRVAKLRQAVKEFITGMVNADVKIRDYKTPKSVVDRPEIINDRFLIKRLGSQTDFKGEGTKTTEATVRETIKEAITQGILEEANLIELQVVVDKRTKQMFYVVGPDF